MKPAVHLQTKFGFEFYNAVFSEFNKAKNNDCLDVFKTTLRNERETTERDLLTLLDDPVMIRKYKMDDNDETGWMIYKELSDRFSTLNHFYNRK